MLPLTDAYLAEALIPALNRLGIRPVGAFKVDIGPETPALYLLLPSRSADTLTSLHATLASDAAFAKAAAPFNTASAERPGFRRIDSALLEAFDNFTYPAVQGAAPRRIFQLRTYESPTPDAHERKIAMFQQGEIAIFRANGLHPVFFGRNLIGQNLPSLTYMLTFKDTAELEANWHAFSADPAWRKLVGTPGNGDEFLVSNITNLMLSPRPYSQI